MNVYVNGETVEVEIEEGMGASILSLDEAEELREKLRACCQEIVDAQPDYPVVEMDFDDWVTAGKPRDTNLRLTKKGGGPEDVIVIYSKLKRLIA